MPMDDFKCNRCGGSVELVLPYDDRDKRRLHPPVLGVKCGGYLKRVLSGINIGAPGYKMKAVMGNGEVVDGSWGGKYAPADRKKKAARKKKAGLYLAIYTCALTRWTL